MKQYFTELTDLDGNKHVADLQDKDNVLGEEPTTVQDANSIMFTIKWAKVQDDQWIQMSHVKSFKIVVKES